MRYEALDYFPYAVHETYLEGRFRGEVIDEFVTFDQALAVATATAAQTRVIVYKGEVIWPPSLAKTT
jgi:hypothetical protein